MIHQQNGHHQRRRSSIHQSVVQHASASGHHVAQNHPVQKPHHDKAQDVKVEITEVKG